MFKSVTVVLCVLSATLRLHAATYYVDASRPDDSGGGTSWATAKQSIESATYLAAEGDSVIVTNGVYSSFRVYVDKGVAIQSINGAAVTVIDGGGNHTCVFSWATNTIVTGFTLRNGQADNGGGAYKCTLNNCVLTNNSAIDQGGGSYSCKLNNCLLVGNSAGWGGGGSSGGTLNNCTLVGNVTDNIGGGIYDCTLNNCIVWGNTGRFGSTDNSVGGTFTYSCTAPLHEGIGNMSADPRFVDSLNGDYRLRADSPCINAGVNGLVVGTADLSGGARIVEETVDMGAYERQYGVYDIGLCIVGYGEVSSSGGRVVSRGESLSFVTPGLRSRPFLYFLTNGVWATSAPVFTWENIQADGTVTAVFDGLYVDASRPDDAGDGLSWQTAKQTLQAAVDAATNNESIVVTNGVYSPIISFDKAVMIQSVNGAAETIIDGGGTNQCAVFFDMGSLTGFTLRNGYGNLGGGAYGGTLNRCILTGNWAGSGGGAYVSTLNNCTLSNNWAGGGGGACFSTLYNCLLTGNWAGSGGGSAYGFLYYCTLAGNWAGSGGGSYGDAPNNCIVWNNQRPDGTLDNYAGGSIQYSCTTPLPDGIGNLSSDPRFVDSLNGDYRLRSDSPCIDAGINRCVIGAVDLAGNSRISGNTVDMGAYEGGILAYCIRVDVVGYGAVSPSGTRVVFDNASMTFTAEPGARPFLHFLTNGVWATSASVFTWENLPLDGTVTAVFAGLYVNAGRPDDTGDGLGWATAKKSLQAAVDSAGAGDYILVTNGVYAPINTDNKSIAIRSVNGAAVTVIDGGGTNRCAKLCTDTGTVTNAVLAGFTLRNGHASDGGGSLGGTLNACTLTGNVASYGGGSYDGTLNACTLSGNSAQDGGGACGGTLNNCTLSGNLASWGGGSYAGTLNFCMLSGNLASEGGGSYVGTLINCIVWGNSASSRGGGSYGGKLSNCTLSRNIASECGGAYEDGEFHYSINNCVIWDNKNVSGEIGNYTVVGMGGAIHNSCTSPLMEDPDVDYENIEADPRFVDPEGGDFRLRPGSPCVDWGSTVYMVSETDFLGNPRWQGLDVDMGAYEGPVAGHVIAVRVQGRGAVSPDVAQVVTTGGERSFTATPGPCAFRHYLTNGVFASASPDFTWRDIAGDGTLTAVFDSADGYVDASRPDDSGDGLSWATAKCTLQAAVDQAIAGDTVWVTNGVYAPVFVDNKAISLRSVNGAGATVIDGGGISRCVSVLLGVYNSHTNTVLTGFTLRNGAAFEGGGALGASLNACILSGNTAYYRGGGACFGVLNGCTLSNNTAAGGGGAAKSALTRCWVIGNAANSGGGTTESVLTDCVVSGNQAEAEGGGTRDSSLDSCTVALNTASEGGGVYGCVLNNSIVWGNQASDGENFLLSDYGCAFFYSCTAPLPSGTGNVSTDPLFVNPAKGVFRLSPYSPCINAGTNAWVKSETDLEGAARIVDGTVDMGAYETMPLSMALNCSNLVWTTGGNAYWFAQAAETADGAGALQSGPIGDNQSVWLQSATEGKGTLRFAWRASSESRDYLRFYVDGQPGGAMSGAVDWQTVTLAVTNAGSHIFRWEYVKGKSGAAGEDAGWLDQVVWSQAVVTVSVAVVPVVGGRVTGGGAYIVGRSTTLVAAPLRGWRFDRWENGETNPRRVLVVPDGGCTCTAHFVRDAIPLSEALDTTALEWTTNSLTAWKGWVLTSAHDGSDAAQSGVIGNLGSSLVSTEVTGPGALSFWWRVSCEEDFDYLDFDLDGYTLDWLTGESGWQQVTLRLAEGTHTLAWEYWKDESDSAGDDAAWLDQVVWSPDTPPLIGFALWAAKKELAGDPATVFGLDRNGDGIANGFEYAYGTNLTSGVLLLNIRMISGHPLVETLKRDFATTNDVDVTVQGCTNLLLGGWTLPVGPATNTLGKPGNRDWFSPQGVLPDKAFFRLRAVQK